MSKVFAREFEKYFPLPLSYDNVRCLIKDNNGHFIMKPAWGNMTNEQTEYTDDFARHLVTCANLMPEAERLIRYAIKREMEICKQCQHKNDDCSYCRKSEQDLDMKNFLAKLEGGTKNA